MINLVVNVANETKPRTMVSMFMSLNNGMLLNKTKRYWSNYLSITDDNSG